MLPPYKSLNITSSLGFVAIVGFVVAIGPFVLENTVVRKRPLSNELNYKQTTE